MTEILQSLRSIIGRSPELQQLQDFFKHKRVSLSGIAGSLSCFVAAEIWQKQQRNIVIIAPNPQIAEYHRDDLSLLFGEDVVGYFPRAETHARGRYFRATSDEFRVDALEKLLQPPPAILVTEIGALFESILEKHRFESSVLTVQRGEDYNFEQLINQLVSSGYSRESAVTQPLDLSVRGGIVDVFPLGAENPYRLEFFGETLDSIRTFNISSQRSVARVDSVRIPPAVSDNGEEHSESAYLWDYFDETTILYWFSEEDISDHDLLQDDENASNLELIRDSFQNFIVSRLPSSENDLNLHSSAQDPMRGDIELLQSEVDNLLEQDYQVYICCENAEQVFRLKKLLIPNNQLSIISQELSRGFVFSSAKIAVFTDHQIYSRFRSRRTFQKFAHEEIPRSVDHLSLGDFLVHQDYGIGVYRGLQTMTRGKSEFECLVIEYQDGDKVFVPLQKFHRVQKYQGTEGTSPRIHKLGGSVWERAKQRSREAASEIAEDLVQLYAQRHSVKGYSFSEDDEMQYAMESAFIYDETEDQILATHEVKEDMESPFPMDRLLIGDVGFGKTEVAIRSAFKSVMDSKQVAVLVPTTILSEQHYVTFTERLERFPVRIAAISRFRSTKEQKDILHKLKSGDIDIIIGTHRLLSKDVQFKNLGLVVIDEEHRFGVKHKEKLKKMVENVDVLSMTATPIPRTLQLSLSGARDLSKIETPPKERLPIYTEIASFEDSFIREVIMREINRGGQVYFVHNRIQSIDVIKKRLVNILPDLRFAVGHGQMPGASLEKVMLDFLHRKYDVLISTAIIESGIDIPNVNTIIINRADHLGLAQLYQLRGRVGRANRRAYAYLLVPSKSTMTGDARNRLQTLESFTHLGAGFQIAMKDLAMRGAGNLLGMKQSGYIDAVGFDLYMEMINEEIQKHQIERGLESLPGDETVETEVNTLFETLIPEEYVPDPDQRIDFYRRLSGAKSQEEIQGLSDEIEDRFGPIPNETNNLIESIHIKVLSSKLGIERITVSRERARGQFVTNDSMKSFVNFDQIVPSMLELSENTFIPKFTPDTQLHFILKYRNHSHQLTVLKYYLKQLLERVKFSNSS